MVVSLLGSTGHMGMETLKQFLFLDEVNQIKVLLRRNSPRNKYVLRLIKKHKDKVKVIYGNITNKDDVEDLIEGSDYLFNLAAVIPPLSEQRPDLSYRVNELGVKNVIEVLEKHPHVKYIHISTVAVYGHRNYKHPFERVGDPLIPSVYDVYSVHKIRAEFALLESNVSHFVILRQTAMIYLKMLTSNMKDGLMFHTCFNDPLEWTTDSDSASLMAAIIKEDINGTLSKDNFWNKIFNMGDKKENRVTGYKTFDDGFKLIGGSVKDFFKPNDNVLRNFHGGFYLDGLELDKILHYEHESLDSYWEKIKNKHPYFILARIVPKKFIRKFVIEKLYKDKNSPVYWYKNNDIARLTAFYGSKEIYESQPLEWENFVLWDYQNYRDSSKFQPIEYGYDISKDDKDISFDDLKSYASLRGGKLLSIDYQGDIYQKLEWENADGVRFIARAYTVIKGGHWLNPLYKSYTWDFDRLAKKDKLIATYWYDSHEQEENHTYYMDEKFVPLLK